MVAGVGSTQLITVGNDDIPVATLPRPLGGDTVTAHMARANPHWRQSHHRASALVVVAGSEAHISPSRYGSKAEHGKSCRRGTTPPST
jgi:transcriptional regulator